MSMNSYDSIDLTMIQNKMIISDKRVKEEEEQGEDRNS